MVRKGKKGKKTSVFDKAVKAGPPPRRERKMERGIKVPPKRQYRGLPLAIHADRGFVHCSDRSRDSAADPGRGFHVQTSPSWLVLRHATGAGKSRDEGLENRVTFAAPSVPRFWLG